jgi:hypothetical protein
MPDEDPTTPLGLRQADQARTDFAALESDLKAIYARLERMPPRAYLAPTALGIILCTAVTTALCGWWLMLCP